MKKLTKNQSWVLKCIIFQTENGLNTIEMVTDNMQAGGLREVTLTSLQKMGFIEVKRINSKKFQITLNENATRNI